MAVGESWGRYPHAHQRLLAQHHRDQSLPESEQSLLAYGNGRSYGDVCLNDGGNLLQTRGLDRYIDFDGESGVLRCEAGVLLADILALVVPRGWFLPVMPGTRFVTVGGAIANDVHGKNHHVAGSFGHHLLAFELLRSDGSRKLCTREENSPWFAATVGGLGLTGLVTWAELQLRRIDGPTIASETIRFDRLEEFFELSAASAASHEFTVAWIDCVARGTSLGRGLFTRGNHASAGQQGRARSRGAGPTFPALPFSLVNPLSLRAFNGLYWRKQLRHRRQTSSHYEPFLYPLDGIQHWNRMYGPRGFLQYQCVLPPAVAADGNRALLARIAASGTGSFLAVLKQFGDLPSPGLLSFPRPGTTLALDFPIDRNGRVFELLDQLDGIVSEAGGAVYPAKDARMSGRHFRQYFPSWQAFAAFIDPKFSSGFWRRVMES